MKDMKVLEFETIMAELEEAERMAKMIDKKVKEAKKAAEKFLEDNGVDEFATEKFKAIYRDVVTNRFDTTAFKAEHPRLYKEYLTENVTRPFKHWVFD